MPNFSYTANTADGNVQKGIIEAGSQAAAVNAITEKGLKPLVIKEVKREFKNLDIKMPGGNKVKSKDLVVFTRQFATMVNAGVPMVRSLSTMVNQTDSPALKTALQDISEKVEGGHQLSESMGHHPKIFSAVYINMIKAGEEGGILDQIMDRLALQVEKDSEIKGKLKSAMIYPAIITLITIGAFIFIMTGIIPKLATIFEQFDGQLPLQTRIMLGISNFMLDHGIILAGAAGAAVFAFIRTIHTERGKYVFDKLLLKTPVFGNIVLKVNAARFSRTFSSLTSAGVSVLDSLKVTAGALSNSVIRKGIEDSVERVRNGQPISKSLEEANVFPPMIIQMTAIGEETGQVDTVLEKIAEYYEKEVDQIVSGLTSIIEPILIVVLGGMVGMIVASVFGPIASISENI